jgi:hypothetical protein
MNTILKTGSNDLETELNDFAGQSNDIHLHGRILNLLNVNVKKRHLSQLIASSNPGWKTFGRICAIIYDIPFEDAINSDICVNPAHDILQFLFDNLHKHLEGVITEGKEGKEGKVEEIQTKLALYKEILTYFQAMAENKLNDDHSLAAVGWKALEIIGFQEIHKDCTKGCFKGHVIYSYLTEARGNWRFPSIIKRPKSPTVGTENDLEKFPLFGGKILGPSENGYVGNPDEFDVDELDPTHNPNDDNSELWRDLNLSNVSIDENAFCNIFEEEKRGEDEPPLKRQKAFHSHSNEPGLNDSFESCFYDIGCSM